MNNDLSCQSFVTIIMLNRGIWGKAVLASSSSNWKVTLHYRGKQATFPYVACGGSPGKFAVYQIMLHIARQLSYLRASRKLYADEADILLDWCAKQNYTRSDRIVKSYYKNICITYDKLLKLLGPELFGYMLDRA